MHDHRMVGRTALHRVEFFYRRGIGRISAQAVDRLGGKCDQPAAPEDLRRATDFVVHSLSGGALRTASVCLRRKSGSFFFMASSPRARIAMADTAGLAPPPS